MSEIEKYYNGEIIVDFEEENELEKKYNEVAELYSKAIHKKIEYKHRIDKVIEYIEERKEDINNGGNEHEYKSNEFIINILKGENKE